MKAFVVEEHGGPEALRLVDRPIPEPGPGEVRLRVRAAALNHLDLWVRRGVPGHQFPLPLIPGSDGIGSVDAVGEGVTACETGEDYIISPGYGCGGCGACLSGDESLCPEYRILGEARDGTCAEYIVVPAACLLTMPRNLEPEAAACLPLTLMTAWRMLVRRARLSPGETVLVHAGGSGVGSAAIQIAKSFACPVLTTVGSETKAEKAKTLGADQVIRYREEDVAAAVRKLTGKRGVDVVVEHTGEETWQASIRSLARGGRLVTCGATTGAMAHIDLRVLFFKQISIIGSTMGSRADLLRALQLVEAGRIQPIMDKSFPMEKLPEAHLHLENRRAFGKVTLRGFK